MVMTHSNGSDDWVARSDYEKLLHDVPRSLPPIVFSTAPRRSIGGPMKNRFPCVWS